jgi:hypothetical protein
MLPFATIPFGSLLPGQLPAPAGSGQPIQLHRASPMTSSRSRSQVLLGHKKLDTTPLYTRVAISAIGEVTSPLDLLLKMPA